MGLRRDRFNNLRRVLILLFSVLLLDLFLAWTLDHTDIVACATVFLVGIGFQAILLFSLIKSAAPENSVGGQLSERDMSAKQKNRGEYRSLRIGMPLTNLSSVLKQRLARR